MKEGSSATLALGGAVSRHQRWEPGPEVLTPRLMPQREDTPRLLLRQASPCGVQGWGKCPAHPEGQDSMGSAQLGAAPPVPKPCSFPGSAGHSAERLPWALLCPRLRSRLPWRSVAEPAGASDLEGKTWRGVPVPHHPCSSLQPAGCTYMGRLQGPPLTGTPLEALQPCYPRTHCAGSDEDQRWFCLSQHYTSCYSPTS